MNTKSSTLLVISLALLISGCASSPRNLILGKWEADAAMKLTAEFERDGTARITMFGQALQGTYRLTDDNELIWMLNGRTTKSKVHVTAKELELTDDANQTIKYKRK